MGKVLTETFRCNSCDFSWVILGAPLNKDAITDVSGEKLCVKCFSYEINLQEIDIPKTYNPYNLHEWKSRFVKKELFFCCGCRKNIFAHHQLSSDPISTVIVFSFKNHPLHTLCINCLVFAATTGLYILVPEFCCLPEPYLTVEIKSKTGSIIKGMML